MGGVDVLSGNFVLDEALISSPQTFVSWLMMECIPLCSAIAMLIILWTFNTTSLNQ
ncbi:TPA: MFS transporter [Klebsiella pneumoniae]|nr:MFS transporter [Klebsiella pneumoniae]